MVDRTCADQDWNVADQNGGITWDRVHIAVLMDIRRELRKLNVVLNCPSARAIPDLLRKIDRNTARKKPKRKTP